MNIFVASLSFQTRDEKLQSVFEEFGEVSSARIVFDKETRKSKGFGFVEMPNDDEALSAIQNLNDIDLDGRKIVVKKAEQKNN